MWKKAIKEVLSLPPEAQVLSVYEYVVPKGNKVHKYLRCEYLLGGTKRTKHVPRYLEGVVRKVMKNKEREIALKILDNIYYQAQQLKHLHLDHSLKEQLMKVVQELQAIAEADSNEL